MGISSDGVLVFGIDFGEDLPLGFEDDEDRDFEDFLANEAGYPPWSPNGPDDYFVKKREIVEACPVDVTLHCSYDYPMYVLGPRGYSFSASRGYAEEISPDKLAVPVEKIEAMKAWFEKYGIPWQEPKWLLCSLYG